MNAILRLWGVQKKKEVLINGQDSKFEFYMQRSCGFHKNMYKKFSEIYYFVNIFFNNN